MITVPCNRRTILGAASALAIPSLLVPRQSLAQCVRTAEEGRWRNLTGDGSPVLIDLRRVNCPDQGEEAEMHYKMRVWVRQSPGKLYGRPSVKAQYRSSEGARWLFGRVPTGGYVDNIWVRARKKDGRDALYVFIKHESLDSKPSATSKHWFKFDEAI